MVGFRLGLGLANSISFNLSMLYRDIFDEFYSIQAIFQVTTSNFPKKIADIRFYV